MKFQGPVKLPVINMYRRPDGIWEMPYPEPEVTPYKVFLWWDIAVLREPSIGILLNKIS